MAFYYLASMQRMALSKFASYAFFTPASVFSHGQPSQHSIRDLLSPQRGKAAPTAKGTQDAVPFFDQDRHDVFPDRSANLPIDFFTPTPDLAKGYPTPEERSRRARADAEKKRQRHKGR